MSGSEKYNAIHKKSRDLINLKSSMRYVFSNYYDKIKVHSDDSLPTEKRLTFQNGSHNISTIMSQK